MKFPLLFILLFPLISLAQGRLMSHFFKPGVKMGLEYQPAINGDLSLSRTNLGLSIPIKSKLGLGIKLKELNLENITNPDRWGKVPGNLTKVFKPKLHQIFWNVNFYHNNFHNGDLEGFYLDRHGRNFYGGNTGITGFHYLRKARILFYSANIGFLEEQEYFKQLHPTANALIGLAQVTGLHSILYLGAYATYADKRVLPIPIFGFDTRLARNLRVNVTLPVQFKLTFKKRKKKNSFSVLTRLAGFQGGAKNLYSFEERAALRYSYLKTGFQYQRKIGKKSKLTFDLGYAYWKRMSLRGSLAEYEDLLGNDMYISASFHRTFGKALFDGNLGNFLN